MDLAIVVNRREKTKTSGYINKYLDLARKLKRFLNMKVRVIPLVVGTIGRVPQGMGKRLSKVKIRGRIKIIQTSAEISKNTETGAGELRKLAVIQTSVKKNWCEKVVK